MIDHGGDILFDIRMIPTFANSMLHEKQSFKEIDEYMDQTGMDKRNSTKRHKLAKILRETNHQERVERNENLQNGDMSPM